MVQNAKEQSLDTSKLPHFDFALLKNSKLTIRCECMPGFAGINCSINIDDCNNHKCRNKGICVVGTCIASLKIRYETSFNLHKPFRLDSGRHWIIFLQMCYGIHWTILRYSARYLLCLSEYSSMFYFFMWSRKSPLYFQCCIDDSLESIGSCYNNERMKEYECRCYEGYSGEKCDKVRSIGLAHQSAYVSFEHWDVENGNLTLTIRTTHQSGVIAYYGDRSFLSVELYDGRVKIAFYIGNHPASHMYSFATVSDGLPHKIEILIQGKKCSLTIDNNTAQSVENDGPLEKFVTDTKQNLYIGGLSSHQETRIKAEFHVRHTHSFKGCISDLFVNTIAVDFEQALEKWQILPGCANVIDLCAGMNLRITLSSPLSK
ncbi:LRRNT [Parelaphostrongylus tenuis]|uniref:LRRNT n=1 Tax=Parelaphostrongylus tenuis TaxID=148309 RepID=A0AAD5M7B6_PARTN|nr:LRRNT [Parelaphostrongylus tenuis]